jgi:hypothetical protein
MLPAVLNSCHCNFMINSKGVGLYRGESRISLKKMLMKNWITDGS